MMYWEQVAVVIILRGDEECLKSEAVEQRVSGVEVHGNRRNGTLQMIVCGWGWEEGK